MNLASIAIHSPGLATYIYITQPAIFLFIWLFIVFFHLWNKTSFKNVLYKICISTIKMLVIVVALIKLQLFFIDVFDIM
jgi:hypothetical protein